MKLAALRTRAALRAADGVLLVLREPPPPPPPAAGQPPAVPADPAEGPEVLLALADDGGVLLLAGHVDLGTGLATAYRQLVAEELVLPPECVEVVLGDTARGPNQGPTIASTSIQIHAAPLRAAAAQARAWLVAQAAERLAVAADTIELTPGRLRSADGRELSQAELLAGRHVELLLDLAAPLRPADQQRLVGQSLPRLDLPAKVRGEAVYVHDFRLPGMRHGRVVRPPYCGRGAGGIVGRSQRGTSCCFCAQIRLKRPRRRPRTSAPRPRAADLGSRATFE